MKTIARHSNACLQAAGATLGFLGLLTVAAAGLHRAGPHSHAAVTGIGASTLSANTGRHNEADAMFGDDLIAPWPEHVGAAARVFQCAPPASRDTRQSVIVWTDARYQVIAYGAALEEEQVPAYALGLSAAAAIDPSRNVHAATPGFRVQSAYQRHALTMGGTTLGCVASADE